ncbi:hypothetical protein ACS0TY_005006 [Phlomoides rotata]
MTLLRREPWYSLLVESAVCFIRYLCFCLLCNDMDTMLEKLSLSKDEVDELVLEPSVENLAAAETPEFCLVGRFLTDQPINFSLMKSRMASIWRPKKGLYVKDIEEGRYVFQFFHRVDVKCVEDGSPWSFGTYLLLLHRLDKGDHPLQVPLLWVNFWVHVCDLPLGFFSERIGQQLGDFMGRFVEYDESNRSSNWRSFMRIKVLVDVTKALKRGKCIKKADGSVFVVSFKYEKLNQFYFVCDRLGHTENFCEVVFNAPEGEDVRRDWGPLLKAPDRRNLFPAGDRWLRGESGGLEGDFVAGGDGGMENVYACSEDVETTMEKTSGYMAVNHADKENFELTITDTKKRMRQMASGDVGSMSGYAKESELQVAVSSLGGAHRES